MDDVEEKRIYGDRAGRGELLVAAAVGVVTVGVSGGRVGEFGVLHRCSPRDVAAHDGTVAVATDEDVIVRDGGDEFRGTGFGPAVAVGFGPDLVAAGPRGRIARYDDEWRTVGRIDGVNAIDGDLLAAEDGVYRVDDELAPAGLDDARDVSARGVPLAATAEGLYALGNGWLPILEGDFRVVASDGERAHAATKGELYERERRSDQAWEPVDLPTDEPIAGVAYADSPYAVTRQGTILAPDGEWRAHALGLADVSGIVAMG